ncbi:VWA domain-containing protein [Desulfotruncus alcoholivorax]|uniref:VWA domain-containing protein n=1 Tax=Desulfotruncus alcoholivorax TaxID=265477 RepID=UPI0004183152|nr:VWA domain-containing protein [Desulfotruncus alcoholivorax]
MGVSFSDPLWWLLLPLLGWLAWRLRLPWLQMPGPESHKQRERRRLYTRLLLLFLLIAALTGPGFVSTINRQAVVFALDVSDSVGSAVGKGEQWIREALGKKPAGTVAGVISFGRQALVEEPPGEQPSFYRAATDPGPESSVIGEALRFSRSILPRDARRRVVLVTDGRDTGGDAVAAARSLHAEGVRVDVVPAGAPAGPDIRLDSLHLSPRSRVGENTLVEIAVTSDNAVDGDLYLERDDQLLAARPVQLQPGENRLTLSVPAGEAGLHRYRVKISPLDRSADAFAANNEAGGIQEVSGPPRVLVLAEDAAQAQNLAGALRASGRVDVEIKEPAAAPRGIAGWARYQAVFLLDVPAYSLGEHVMSELETYVRDVGGGLVMTGGPDSFGPGGYAGTALERALPVSMDIKGRGEMPSLGLMLVIDKSGSMAGMAGGAEKIALARDAAARSVSMLTKRDRVGVVAFDTMPWWVAPPGPVEDKEKLQQLIGSIQAGGGTEIYPPLLAAYQTLRDLPTQVKHIILLTDGISASGGDYQSLLADMRSDGISLSTVAVGAEADAGMLKALSELGRGRFYATADADSIPSIFTKETLMATRSFAVNEKFYPQVAYWNPLLRGLEQVPPLNGYITVSPKELAETLLVSPRGDPVLAAWQYGLGRSVAWTPDAGGRWSTDWLGAVFPRLWGNVLSWILPADTTDSLRVQADVIPGSGLSGRDLQVEVEDSGGWREVRDLKALVTGPGGDTVTVPLNPDGPGRYSARQPAGKPGAYLVAIAGGGKEQSQLLARGGVVVPYSSEYQETGVDSNALQAIARAGGGAVLEKPEQAFLKNLPPVQARRDLTPLLLALAAIVWLGDVTGRRLIIGAEERAALRRYRQLIVQKLLPGRAANGDKPAWAGETLSAVQNLRLKRRETAGPEKPFNRSGDAPAVEKGTSKTSEKNTGAVGSKKDETRSDKNKEAKKEATASRLLDAKRRGFKE